MTTRRRAAAILAVGMALALAGCGLAGAGGGGGAGPHGVALRVAIVANPQMQDVESLTSEFEKANPAIKVNYVTLPENESRAKITASVSTKSNEFDVVMISNYETPLWASYRWITDLQPYIEKTPGYDQNDFIPSIRKALSWHGHMYSVPFYGESSILVYRKDLFKQAGLHMPEHPTWAQIAQFAARLNNKKKGIAGICLRGESGWGQVLAPLDTVINTFGGRWYDMNWHAQLTSPTVERAVSFYVNLVSKYGEPGAAGDGFTECATQYGQGKAAMWYDATSAAGSIEAAGTSTVVGKNGYVEAPVMRTSHSGWLYTWSLGIPITSPNKEAAWQFIFLGYLKSVYPARRREARLGQPATRKPALHLRDSAVRQGRQGVRAADAPRDRGSRSVPPDGPASPLHRDPVPRHS